MKIEKHLNIICAGECMLELRREAEHYMQGFAGDVPNFAIYLKRLIPAAKVQFFSAIGRDSQSQDMRHYLEQAGLDTSLLFNSPDGTVGLYMIKNDDTCMLNKKARHTNIKYINALLNYLYMHS